MGLKDDDEILKYFTCSHYDTCFVDFQNDKEDKYEGTICDVFFNAVKLQKIALYYKISILSSTLCY